MKSRFLWTALSMLALFGVHAWAQVPLPLGERMWRPIADDVYLQEVGRQIDTEWPVMALAAFEERLFIGMESGVRVMPLDATGETEIVGIGGPITPIYRLRVAAGWLWALGSDGAQHFDGRRWGSVTGLAAHEEVYDVCEHLGMVYLASSSGLYRVDPLSLAATRVSDRGGFVALASFNETLYCADPRRLYLLEGDAFDGVNVADWGEQPAGEYGDMLAAGSRLYLATDEGPYQLQGMTLSKVKRRFGLPSSNTTCLARGFEGDLWIGTSTGAARVLDDDLHFFNGARWLPDNHVNAIAVHDRTVYIGTPKGLGIIEYEPYTLLKKAAYYERWLEEWGQKRLGFTYKLEWDAPTGTWMREVSDNDAGWSTHYLTAQSFKYAVTGHKEARDEAVDFFKTLKWCEEISSIDGFPARSIYAVGETTHKTSGGSGGYAAEWNPTPDGLWEWKGDTSSDETDAHYYAAAIFYELVAKGREKEQAQEHLSRITNHIIDNGWVLRDVDGKPTVWARWDPEYLQGPRGFYARGLNGLGILSYVKTAETITGDPKFTKAYQDLLDMGYHREVLRQKLVFPPDYINHSDDRLAWYIYYNLLRYETDPELRSIYRRSFERSWEIERIERNPWFNFIYGGITRNDCDEADSVAHLREWPLDMVDYSYANSNRADITPDTRYSDHARVTRVLSPRETGPMRWSDTPRLDGGSGGHAVVDPAGWLDAYWMARYYGIIEAPTTKDRALTTVERNRGLSFGAKPYDGPPRPPIE